MDNLTWFRYESRKSDGNFHHFPLDIRSISISETLSRIPARSSRARILKIVKIWNSYPATLEIARTRERNFLEQHDAVILSRAYFSRNIRILARYLRESVKYPGGIPRGISTARLMRHSAYECWNISGNKPSAQGIDAPDLTFWLPIFR